MSAPRAGALCERHTAQVDAWTHASPATARLIRAQSGRAYVDVAREQLAAIRADCAAGRGCQ